MMSPTSFILTMGAALLVATDARSAMGLGAQQTLRAGSRGARPSLIVSGKADQKLRICNAFAFDAPLDITHVRSKASLGSLPYKGCEDYKMQLNEGDQLDFKVAGTDVGTFAVAGLPQASRILLLIVQKRADSSMGASFKSHAFAEEAPDSAQIAVIDTYGGAKNPTDKVDIFDVTEPNITLRKSEALPLNSVVSISPGSYQVAMNSAGLNTTGPELSAEGKTSYVVFRVGEGGKSKEKAESFPEELVVFPSPGGARSAAALGSGLLLAALLQLFLL
mmetsp:Transcript_23037/g.49026  ORF Transcript_23037/g.49026 Transcript_23037/m.49026 type:complete len:277 (+) Transcript_23037:64-894(+)